MPVDPGEGELASTTTLARDGGQTAFGAVGKDQWLAGPLGEPDQATVQVEPVARRASAAQGPAGRVSDNRQGA